jgi:hypothetical protein
VVRVAGVVSVTMCMFINTRWPLLRALPTLHHTNIPAFHFHLCQGAQADHMHACQTMQAEGVGVATMCSHPHPRPQQ